MTDKKVCLFAGTSEGRLLAQCLDGQCGLCVCVASEYGQALLAGLLHADVRTGRLDEKQMEELFEAEGFALIIDATHPYAQEVSKNIRQAAQKKGVRLIRVERACGDVGGVQQAVLVQSAQEAAQILQQEEGNVFLATGAKEIACFAGLARERLYVRVLPSVESLSECAHNGIYPSHILAAQGPFTLQDNLAHFRPCRQGTLVSKQSGRPGGFEEKVEAARQLGMRLILIGRCELSQGMDYAQAVREIEKELGVCLQQEICIVGCGCGGTQLLTAQAREALSKAACILGAKRLESLCRDASSAPFFSLVDARQIAAFIKENRQFARIAVAMTGDTGFYSGAKKLHALLDGKVQVVPGISSVACFAAKLGQEWDDACLMSLHARDANLLHRVRTEKKIFVLTGGVHTVGEICRTLMEYGYGDLEAAVGEALSCPEESICTGVVRDFIGFDKHAGALLFLHNPLACKQQRFGIEDEAFVRGQVPMRKREVRAVALSRLALLADSVVYDVGAGTGSVAVECALAAYDGQVYAVEKEEEAVAIIEQNKKKFAVPNLTVVHGDAPHALQDLPAPIHAFIGGSSGNLLQILETVLAKNPRCAVVISAVTLQTIAQATACMQKRMPGRFETVVLNTARSRRLGRYDMMCAQNPVYLFYGRNEE